MLSKRWKRTSDFECQIILSEPDTRLNNCLVNSLIQGSLVISAKRHVEIYGLGIRLEGKARSILLRKSKGGDRAEYRRSEFYFLHLPFDNFELNENNLIHLTPLDVEESVDDDFTSVDSTWTCQRRLILKQGKGIYRFSLNLELLLNNTNKLSPIFPASFKHDFGSIQYYISLYMKMKPNSSFVRVCERILPSSQLPAMIPVPSIYSLVDDESTRIIVKRREGSRRETFIEGHFKLNKLNYLVGENIQFYSLVENQCDSSIYKISVLLVQKLAFRAGGYLKSVFQPIVLKDKVNHELREMMKTGNFFEWEDNVRLPDDKNVIMPTFKTDEKCLEIFYFVQFIVTLTGNGTLTGEIPITISTYRQSSESSFHDKLCNCNQMTGLIDSAPSYSQLSLETLPPPYDDTMKKDERAIMK